MTIERKRERRITVPKRKEKRVLKDPF